MAFEDFAEYGSSAVNSEWTTISLSKAYARNIAIFAEVNSFNDGTPSSNRKRNTLAPVEIRLRNISKGSGSDNASFDIKIQRPYGYDSTHPSETVSFLAICEGTWDLVDGSRLEVGIYDRIHTKNNKFQNQVFSTSFSSKPGLISQVQTTAGTDWITLRHKNISATGFQVAHQEDEYQNKKGSKEHLIESLAYLAFDDGFSTTDGDSLLEGKLLDSSLEKIDHTGGSFSFLTTNFSQSPVLLTQNVSYNGGNPAKTRLSSLSSSGFSAYIQEDRSRDKETWHYPEEISYFAVADGTKFQGEIVDPAAAPSIQGLSGNPGDASSSISINENETEIGLIAANETVAWSLTGGSDQALFTINSSTGELSFNSAQDYESPGDSDSNNDFVVQVTATDSDNNTSTQTITVNLVDLDETPPVAVDNSENLGVANLSNNIDILANDTDNFDSSSGLTVYSVNGTLFDDLDDSEHVTYGADSSFKQLAGSGGTLYIKSDGTSYYLKSTQSSLISALRSSYPSSYLPPALQANGVSSSNMFRGGSPFVFQSALTALETFTYVATDSSGNTSNEASISIKSSNQDECEPGMTKIGDQQPNLLNGCCNQDFLYGMNGDDVLRGYGESDYLDGGYGSDHLFGGSGDDLCVGHLGDDFLFGSDGDDILIGNRGFDQLRGSIGDDVLHAGKGADVLEGGEGSDSLYGGFGLNIFKDEFDGEIDRLYFWSDQWAENWIYGKADNSPNGEKADKIEMLDEFDQIYIQGVDTSQLSFSLVDHNSNLGETFSGIGIYASGVLEAVYVGNNLSMSQLDSMTQGII